MRRHRNVKIVATLGPASSDYKMIRALHEAGADVFRLNMSHGSHEEIAERHAIIRQIEQDVGGSICILADLQGPKLRVGVFANDEGEMLEEGAAFRMDLDDAPGDNTRVQLPHREIFQARVSRCGAGIPVPPKPNLSAPMFLPSNFRAIPTGK